MGTAWLCAGSSWACWALWMSQPRSLPCHPVAWRKAREKAPGTEPGQGAVRALILGVGMGMGEREGLREDGEFVGLFPDDNFDILLSLEDFERGINAASGLICTDCHRRAGG